MVKEEVGILLSDFMTNIGPSDVQPGEESKSSGVSGDRLRLLARIRKRAISTHSLTSDAAENEDLHQGDGGADSVLVEDEELSEPAMSEDLISWGFKKLAWNAW